MSSSSSNPEVRSERHGLKQKQTMRTLSCVTLDQVVGKGTFGLVYKATEIDTGDTVALKKIFMENEHHGFPITAIREIKILKALDHPNVVKLKDVIMYDSIEDGEVSDPGISQGDVMMMFEFCDFDLSGLLKSTSVNLTEQHVRSYLKQILEGVHYMHKNKILHRDIKGANILVTRDNVVKIADWGLARAYYNIEKQKLTNSVVTLWYRCPELILGTTHYGPEIDMWSVGCLFAELKSRTHQPLLPANCKDLDKFHGEMKQLELIYQLCGTPTGELEEKYRSYPNYEKMTFSKTFSSRLHKKQDEFGKLAIDLLSKFLEMDPSKRISAKDALDDDYFYHPDATKSARELPVFRVEAAFSMSEDARRDAEHRKAVEERQRREEEKKLLDEQRAKEKQERSAAAAVKGGGGGSNSFGMKNERKMPSAGSKFTIIKPKRDDGTTSEGSATLASSSSSSALSSLTSSSASVASSTSVASVSSTAKTELEAPPEKRRRES